MLTEPFALLVARVGMGVHRAISRRLDARELTVAQYHILHTLAAGGGRHLRGLAQDLHLRRQTVFAACRALVDRGLIERTSRAHDARLVILSITRDGRHLLAQLESAMTRLERHLTVRLSPEQSAGVERAVRWMGESIVVRPLFEVNWAE